MKYIHICYAQQTIYPLEINVGMSLFR